MTTVVADQGRKIIVADSLVTAPGQASYLSSKLYRANGAIFGEAGDTEAYMRFRRWQLDGATKKDRPKFTDANDFSVLELCKDGLFLWDWAMARERIKDEIYSIGSGADIALYCARVLKHPAERCVYEATKIDRNSLPPVERLTLKGGEEPETVPVSETEGI